MSQITNDIFLLAWLICLGFEKANATVVFAVWLIFVLMNI